jgi:DNA-directed RNA polymerase specialized sigma24 family protein
MTRKAPWDPTREAFDGLLRWLGESPEEAGRAYEIIRSRLIALFVCRGCSNAEDLADETINRVMRATQKEDFIYEGAPIRYFYGVAKMVHLESLRRKPIPEAPVHDTAAVESAHQCLERCVGQLPKRSRQLLMGYYQEQGRARFAQRTNLASTLGVPMSTLRVQAHRIRSLLRECIDKCLEENAPRL